MKKTSIILTLAAMLVAMVSCTKEEQPVSGKFTMTVNADKGTRATKDLSLNGSTLTATWAENEEVEVYQGETNLGTLTATLGGGSSTTLSGTIEGSIDPNENLTLKFLSADYGLQDGTLTYIAEHCDYAVANVTINSISGGSINTSDAVFVNQQAIIRFTLKDKSDNAITPTALTITDGTSTVSLTSIPTTTYSDPNNGDGVLFVAFPAAGSAKTITLTANVGVSYYDYTFEKTGVTFTNGQYYTIGVKMSNRIIHLNLLSANFTAQDGDILTGTLAGNYKISVNTDGAIVTLKNATINGTSNVASDDYYSWAGINCDDNTTLVIEGTNNVTGFYEDYPGIHIASGKTLTIQGTGTLNASSNGGANGWGAGIGGSDLVDCGNIVIKSGIINATGGVWMAGIGGGYNKNCGSITINGGNVTATGGDKAAGIGTGRVITNNTITGGDINISGGTVVATGGIGAAGIGSGFVFYASTYAYNTSSTCGNISISGGEVTATGGDGGENTSNSFGVNSYFSQPFLGGAGIGTGSSTYSNFESPRNCGTITIGNGVTRVTATKGGGGEYSATNSIGKTGGYHSRGSCGTVTIGGTVYWNGSAYQNGGDTYLTQSSLVYPQP